MGWYDDNHDDDDMGDFGMDSQWYKDPPAASSSTRTARVERPEAEWDESKWRKSNFHGDDTTPKTKAMSQYLLTEKDLLPLEYQRQTNSRGFKNMKGYRKRDVERAAWEKHGGPNGLKAAKLDKKNGVKSPRAKPVTKTTGKTMSSTSVAARKGISTAAGSSKAKAPTHEEDFEG